MRFEIKSRWTSEVLFSLETESLKLCVEAAVKSKADLGGAYLDGANLRGANLRGANLRGAYLDGADLGGAYLRRANLGGANLRGANLDGADLRGAYLGGAYLGGAYLGGAKFDIPPASNEQAVKNLDQVRGLILENQELLNMGHWHQDESKWQEHTCAEEAVCGTTHCLAGWLQICSTDEKIRKLDPALAGTLLAPVAAKMFYESESIVIDWLKNRRYAEST